VLKDRIGIWIEIILGMVVWIAVGMVMWIGIGVGIASSPKSPKTTKPGKHKSKNLKNLSNHIRRTKGLPFVVLITRWPFRHLFCLCFVRCLGFWICWRFLGLLGFGFVRRNLGFAGALDVLGFL